MHEIVKKPRHKRPSSAKRARSASGADEGERYGHPSDRGRWSNRRKSEIVLRIFRDETLDALSQELGVTPGKLDEWRDEALAGMQAGLQSRRAVSFRSRSFATWAKLRSPTLLRRTASALNSGVIVRRDRFFLTVFPGLSMEHS